MSVTFQCADCGSDWESKVNRSGPCYCEPCIVIRRKNKSGPVQARRANGELGETTPQTSTGTSTRRSKKPNVPSQETLSELAQKLRDKYKNEEVSDDISDIGETVVSSEGGTS